MTVVGGIETTDMGRTPNGKFYKAGNSSYGPEISFNGFYVVNLPGLGYKAPWHADGTSYCVPQIIGIASRIWGNNPMLTRDGV